MKIVRCMHVYIFGEENKKETHIIVAICNGLPIYVEINLLFTLPPLFFPLNLNERNETKSMLANLRECV
jgi:hypothetical protein